MKTLKLSNILGWLALVPALIGCGGGGGGGSASLGLGSLFGGGGSSISGFGSEITTLVLLDQGGGGIPTLHNPEPATMLLFGTGMAAMAYMRRKR